MAYALLMTRSVSFSISIWRLRLSDLRCVLIGMVRRLDPNCLEPGRLDAQKDRAPVVVIAPNGVQGRIGLRQAVDRLLADQPACQQRRRHLAGRAAAHRTWERQHVAVGTPSRGRENDRCGLESLVIGSFLRVAGRTLPAYYDPEPPGRRWCGEALRRADPAGPSA